MFFHLHNRSIAANCICSEPRSQIAYEQFLFTVAIFSIVTIKKYLRFADSDVSRKGITSKN